MFKYFMASKLLLIVTSLVSTAFFTLFERKIMGLGHYRKGPNKVSMVGLLQPFSDVIKLMSKNEDFLKMNQILIFFFNPLMMLFLSMFFWILLYYWGSSLSMKFSFFLLLMVSSSNIFFMLSMGWVSGSFYSMLGSYRATAQMISYEGIFFLMAVALFWTLSQMSLKNLFYFNKLNLAISGLSLFCVIWIITILAETNRTPFDFSEGESELVSGFNTEYSSGLFSIIFLSEYMNILFFSFFMSLMMGGFSVVGLTLFMTLSFLVVLIRCCYPRFRYDFLMLWSWKFLMFIILPVLMFFFYFNNI